jgi:hypothetical protein
VYAEGDEMRNRVLSVSLAVLMAMFGLIIHAGAQEAKPDSTPETKPPMSVEDIKESPEEVRIVKNLLLRPEYRHDWSDKNGFDLEHTTLNKKNQDTLALAVMYTW